MRRRTPLILALALAACATNPQVDEGKKLISQGRMEEGLAKLEQAARELPYNAEARNAYVTQREALAGAFLREGDVLRAYGDSDAAEATYRRVLQFDPGNAQAQAGLAAIERDRRHAATVREAEQALKRGDYATADAKARAVLAENSSQRGARAVMRTLSERRAQAESAAPKLNLALARPITLEFRDAPIRSVFEVISRSAGVNFVFDRDVRPDIRVTIYVRNTRLDDVIKLVLATNQLERKVMNENSLLVYPNTPAKQKEYQELVTRSFYLANADAKQTAAMIRALVKTRDLYIDEKLNLVVMKDTADAVRYAEQLVATQDLNEPEVMLEVEVLEVASSLIREFGIKYPDRINYGVLAPGLDTSVTTNTSTTIATTNPQPPPLTSWQPSTWTFFVANPVFILNLRQTDGTVNLLANPRIRVKNRDKAKIHIGEKVPVITTTSTANVGVSSAVNYLDVGLKLDVEPNVYLEDEVAIKMQLEVSNILEQLNISGTVAYRLGTRQTATTLRLRDGETQVLAGLISDEDRRAANKIPYLGDLPTLGRLFSSNTDQRVKTEIIMLLTPRVVRNFARPDTVAAEFHSGTDANPGAPPMRLAATAAGALAIAPGAAGATLSPSVAPPPPGVPQPRSAPAATSTEDLVLALSAPGQATIGQEFTVVLGLPARNEGASATIELVYDPAVLNAISGQPAAPPSAPGAPPPPDPGRALVSVVAPAVAGAPAAATQVRFRVVANAPTTATIGVQTLTSTDAAGRPLAIAAPGTIVVTIVGAQGAR
ncbi:MAG TPA: secretin N-terminal domain-containing protein [Burkholderiales bacterium]|nr:secretin N-terminal domain-containing protein [Burkholderiales bacterium]